MRIDIDFGLEGDVDQGPVEFTEEISLNIDDPPLKDDIEDQPQRKSKDNVKLICEEDVN